LATFLFEAKAGHCEYFASSMAILLRAAGIPTRVINGFLLGEYNPVGRDYIIRESDAHSWVEVYIPGQGWVEFDPTPPDPNHREVNLSMQLSQYVDAAELFWNSYVIVYDSGAQLQLFRSAQDRLESVQASFRKNSDRWLIRGERFADAFSARLHSIIKTVTFWAVVILFAIILAAYKHRRAFRTQLQIWRVRQGRGAVNEDVVEQMFYRATRLAERRNLQRRPAETWREWIFGLPDPNRRSILKRALEIFEKSKYGRMPVSADDFVLLENTIRELKQPGRD